MAAVRVSLSWFGTRKSLTSEQRTQAADTFGAEGAFLSAGKKLLDTKHEAYKAVTAVIGTRDKEGNWTNGGTFTSGSSTIDFNGSGAGNIGASNFNNVIFSGAGAKTATGILSITGNITISNNFSAGSFKLASHNYFGYHFGYIIAN